ncbi:NUDIX hydrolase [Paraclostridium bifermentans]|nr:NUDIX hydrolase [Paraclostridium bifermentans]
MRIRYCSRAFIINKENKILLQRFEFPQINGNKTLWVTPGGGIEENEIYEEALERELYEELNIKIQINEAPVLTLDVLIDGKRKFSQVMKFTI